MTVDKKKIMKVADEIIAIAEKHKMNMEERELLVKAMYGSLTDSKLEEIEESMLDDLKKSILGEIQKAIPENTISGKVIMVQTGNCKTCPAREFCPRRKSDNSCG